jgi:hypothetical protein
MKIHIFTEEASIKSVFDIILPKILPENISFSIYKHQGKRDLEKAIAKAVPSISKMPDSKILIVMDQDNADCKAVKKHIIDDLINGHCHCSYFVRIVCRELESWFLGDLGAVGKAYTRFKATEHSHKTELKDVDYITTPHKYLCKIIPEYSRRETLPKIETASKIAPFMNLENNKSKSFNHTIDAIKKLAGL